MATYYETLPNKPLFLQAVGGDPAISYSAYEHRLLMGAIWPRVGAIGFSLRLAQRAAGANWSVDVSPGWAVLGNTAEYDRYLVHVPVTTTLELDTPGSVFNTAPVATRTHRVFAAVYSKGVISAVDEARLVVTEDTGSGAPTPPSSPAYYLELGRFTIGTAQSNVSNAQITNTATHASMNTEPAAIALVGGHVSAGATPKLCIAGGRVVLSGTVQKGSGSFVAGTPVTIGSLSSSVRPATNRYVMGVAEGNVAHRITASSNGDLITTPKEATAWISLDGLTYDLDA